MVAISRYEKGIFNYFKMPFLLRALCDWALRVDSNTLV
jgi:hypothetical protein